MLQRQGVFLKRGVVVSHGRMTGVARLRRKTEVRDLQPTQGASPRCCFTGPAQLALVGMQGEQEKYGKACRGEE